MEGKDKWTLACVNYCAGVEQEWLDEALASGATLGDLRSSYAVLAGLNPEKVRELVEAAKGALVLLDQYHRAAVNRLGRKYGHVDSPPPTETLRAALASLEVE